MGLWRSRGDSLALQADMRCLTAWSRFGLTAVENVPVTARLGCPPPLDISWLLFRRHSLISEPSSPDQTFQDGSGYRASEGRLKSLTFTGVCK